MVCRAEMICVPMITGSMPLSGRAPCAPLPVILMSNRPPPAICGPERIANLPTSSLGRLCMPKICSQGNLSNSPSFTIASAPPRPSSAGWKMRCTVPSKLRVAERYLEAPSSMVVCPSWPQACMRPLWVLRWAKVLSSSIGSASMSARSPIAVGLLPTRIVPTTPVLPMPVVTSQPHSLSLAATIFDVRSSSKPSSGWAWMSRRMAVSSAEKAAIFGSILADMSGLQQEGGHYTTKLRAVHHRIEVAAVRQDIGPGILDQPHQLLGEIERRHHVIAGADRQGPRRDPLQLVAPVVRHDGRDARQHDLGHRDGLVRLGLGGRQIGIVIAHPGGRIERQRAALLVARRSQLPERRGAHLEQATEEGVGLGPGGAQHQPVDPIGMLDRQHLAHRAAGGMAAPMDLPVSQRVDQLQRIVGHLRHAIVDPRERAAAGAAMIVHDGGEAPGELGHVFGPKPTIAAQARHQEERRPLAVDFVVKLRAVAQFQMRHERSLMSRRGSMRTKRAP